MAVDCRFVGNWLREGGLEAANVPSVRLFEAKEYRRIPRGRPRPALQRIPALYIGWSQKLLILAAHARM